MGGGTFIAGFMPHEFKGSSQVPLPILGVFEIPNRHKVTLCWTSISNNIQELLSVLRAHVSGDLGLDLYFFAIQMDHQIQKLSK